MPKKAEHTVHILEGKSGLSFTGDPPHRHLFGTFALRLITLGYAHQLKLAT